MRPHSPLWGNPEFMHHDQQESLSGPVSAANDELAGQTGNVAKTTYEWSFLTKDLEGTTAWTWTLLGGKFPTKPSFIERICTFILPRKFRSRQTSQRGRNTGTYHL